MAKFFYTQVLGRIIFPVYFIVAALASFVRPRVGAELLKNMQTGRALRDKFEVP